jgi:RNA polymerase sigma factor (TIGR02999 family)
MTRERESIEPGGPGLADGGPITLLLSAARRGDLVAADALFRAVYAELRGLAHSHRRRWQGNDTMNTTALVHEAFLKLNERSAASFENRTHFFATASKAMRQVLVNYAEQQGTRKRGGDAVRVALDDSALRTQASHDEVLDLDRALVHLEQDNPRRCRIAECRLFGGMTVDEIAMALELSPATVKREWTVASAQLFRHLQSG